MKPIPPAYHKTHRRTFVKGLATAMAAQTAPLIANSLDSDKKKLGLAIVGLGGYATGCIAPEVSACSHVRLAGVITGSSEKGSEWAKQYTFPEDAIYGYDQIDKLAENLKAAPPVKFDLARRVRVFTTRFQFVELSMTGCFISRKKVPIPSSLVGLARNREVQSQFHAHFNLVQQGQIEVKADNGNIITERTLMNKRKQIEDSFLISLKGYGPVVLRANKDRFEEAVEQLKADVACYAEGVVKQLQQQMDTSKIQLVEALLPSVKQNPPDSYTKVHGPSVPDKFLRQRLEDDIARAFGSAEKLVKDMEVKIVFKDVAYESLVDEKFITVAKKAMKDVPFLYDEFDAVRGEES